ncbi:MAG: endonuclease YncB(thermonuclease family) [Gammaproteobacteria bacterium]|jgi:endonuclease YncB( thermonuclease family)
MSWHHELMNLRTIMFLAAFLAAFHAPAATLTGKVVKVADGDTITILVGTEQHRIRLQGIDAPERKQPYGKASGRSLSALVAGKQVRVEYDKHDRYGRIVGVKWVHSPDTRCDAEPCTMTLDAGLYQLTVGLAWWYRYYAKEQTPEQRGQYEFAVFEAKAKKAGLWKETNAVAPWGWRRQKREAMKSVSVFALA